MHIFPRNGDLLAVQNIRVLVQTVHRLQQKAFRYFSKDVLCRIFIFFAIICINVLKITGMIEPGKLILTGKQQNVIKLVSFLVYIVMIVSAILTFGIVIALQAKIKPTNQFFEE